MNMWLAWLILLAVLVIIFRWLWGVADRLDRRDAEERAWDEYIAELWRVDPEGAAYWEWLRNQ